MVRKHYNIITTRSADFDCAAAELAERAAASEGMVVRIVFFGATADNDDHIERREKIRSICLERFGERMPAIGFVAQAPLRSTLAAEVTTVDGTVGIERHEDYLTLDSCEIISDALHADLSSSIAEQADAVFERMGRILAAEGFAAAHIARQWNYIERITRLATQGQHYQMFNDARSRFYDRYTWPQGYPAATGIGTATGGVAVMFDAVKDARQNVAIDNPLQIAAHAYSQQVLIDRPENRSKTTPKFERARYVACDNAQMVYISGTAAIRGEQSCRADITEQVRMTMDNIAALVGCDNIRNHGIDHPEPMHYAMLRVYIKRRDDVAAAARWLDENYPDVPAVYLLADICRDELLVEIEGIAARYKQRP